MQPTPPGVVPLGDGASRYPVDFSSTIDDTLNKPSLAPPRNNIEDDF